MTPGDLLTQGDWLVVVAASSQSSATLVALSDDFELSVDCIKSSIMLLNDMRSWSCVARAELCNAAEN